MLLWTDCLRRGRTSLRALFDLRPFDNTFTTFGRRATRGLYSRTPRGFGKIEAGLYCMKLELKDMSNSRRKLGEVYFIRAGTLSVNQGDTERQDKYYIMIARMRRRLEEKRKTEKVD